MNVDAGRATGNAYTPSHMDAGTPLARRQRSRTEQACVRVRPECAPADIVSQVDEGTTHWLVPHPRERSME